MNTAHLVIAAEGLLALAKLGLAPEVAIDAINGSSGRSLQTEVRIPKEVLSREFNYGFPLKLMLKDVNIAVDTFCSTTKHSTSNGSETTGEEIKEIPKFFPLVKDLLQK